jgi:hypothetical protein
MNCTYTLFEVQCDKWVVSDEEGFAFDVFNQVLHYCMRNCHLWGNAS